MRSQTIQKSNFQGLLRWERWGLAFLAILVISFATIVEIRSCFQHTRKTDFGVYLRAAHAARTGGDIYKSVDDNGYHYTYPPAFAVVMVPFADAPAGQSREGLLPYPLSVGLWIIFNYILLARIVHVLASLVFPAEPRWSRKWWYARMVPIYVAFGGLFHSIGYGQVNIVVIAMLVEMLRSRITGRSLQSGCWLAGAMVIKVFPAYLLLYPMMRLDKRACAGVLLGLAIGLAAIPVVGMGPVRTEMAYRSFTERVLLPGALGTDAPQDLKELLDMSVHDFQSFLGVIHSNLYPTYPPPKTASQGERLAHNLISLGLTLVTLFVVWRRGILSVPDEIIFVGALMLLMLHITPMSHIYYYSFGVVVAAGLYLKGLQETDNIWPGWPIMTPLIIWGVGTALLHVPVGAIEVLRFRGLGLACSMILWVAAIRTLNARDNHSASIPTVA